MDSSSSYKSKAAGMTNWEYQDVKMAATVVANCQTDMTLFILILNLFLTLKLTLKANSNP